MTNKRSTFERYEIVTIGLDLSRDWSRNVLILYSKFLYLYYLCQGLKV